MDLGKNIKEFRIQSNLSQMELAKKMKIKNYTVGDWERNRSQPSAEQIRELCIIFDISADELLEIDK